MNHSEVERKFLVLNNDFIKEAYDSKRIVQGFLSSVPERTVRVRLLGDQGFITVKGLGNASGTTRFEWEKEISQQEAEQLLEICEPGIIDKQRYFVKAAEHIFEIDVFKSDNEGLIIAEVELSEEDEQFEKPLWLGEEVTGKKAYYNSALAKNPFKNWA